MGDSCNEIDTIIVRAFNEISLPQCSSTFVVSDLHGFARNMPKLTRSEILAGQNKGKLDAVKEYKNRTQLSLIDSKHAIEQWFADNGLKYYQYTQSKLPANNQ